MIFRLSYKRWNNSEQEKRLKSLQYTLPGTMNQYKVQMLGNIFLHQRKLIHLQTKQKHWMIYKKLVNRQKARKKII